MCVFFWFLTLFVIFESDRPLSEMEIGKSVKGPAVRFAARSNDRDRWTTEIEFFLSLSLSLSAFLCLSFSLFTALYVFTERRSNGGAIRYHRRPLRLAFLFCFIVVVVVVLFIESAEGEVSSVSRSFGAIKMKLFFFKNHRNIVLVPVFLGY